MHVLASIVTIYTRKVEVGLLLIFPLMLSHSGRWKAIFWKSSYQSLPCVDTPRNIWPPFSPPCCKYISKLSGRGTNCGYVGNCGDRNKEREHIFTWSTALQCETRANKSKFPGWSTISSYLLALERKLRGRIRSDIWRLYNVQCQSEMPLHFKVLNTAQVKNEMQMLQMFPLGFEMLWQPMVYETSLQWLAAFHNLASLRGVWVW